CRRLCPCFLSSPQRVGPAREHRATSRGGSLGSRRASLACCVLTVPDAATAPGGPMTRVIPRRRRLRSGAAILGLTLAAATIPLGIARAARLAYPPAQKSAVVQEYGGV